MKTKDSEEIVSYMDVTLPYVVDECFYVNEECWKEWQAVGADHVFDRIVQPLRRQIVRKTENFLSLSS